MTQLERVMNTLVTVQFSILLTFSAVLAGLDQWWAINHPESRVWYLESVNAYPELPPGGAAWVIMVSSNGIICRGRTPCRARVMLQSNLGAIKGRSACCLVLVAHALLKYTIACLSKELGASLVPSTWSAYCMLFPLCPVPAVPHPAEQHDPHQLVCDA